MSQRSTPRRHRIIVATAAASAAAAALASSPLVSRAATDTWIGGGGNGNWTTAGNWNSGTGNAPPVATDVLQFGGVTNLTTTNDFAALTQFNGINFLSGAGAFTLGGANSVLLAGDINQQSNANQTISLPLVLDGATVNVNVTAGGSLSLGSVQLGNNASTTVGSLNASTLNINNTVTASTFAVRTDTATNNNMTIASGATFNLTGAFNMGIAPSGAANTQTNLVITGGGTFNATTATNANFNLGLGAGSNTPGGQPRVSLDLTGLSNFVYSTGTAGTGTFGVGNLVTRASSTLRLANTSNSITAASIVIGDTNQSGGNNGGAVNTLFLGAGTNVLNANTINIGFTKGLGSMSFQTTTGSVTIAGQTGGTSRANITVGRGSSATDTNTARTLLLAGHTANVQAGTVVLGNLAGSTGGTTQGQVTFDTGTFDVNSLQLGVDASGTSANGAQGVFTLGTNAGSTGILNVNTQFLLGNITNTSTGTKTDKATFTINGGTANINADMVSVKVGAATGTTLTTTLNHNAGTLNMIGHNIGDTTNPISVINLAGGTLSNANKINGSAITVASGYAFSGGTPTFVLPNAGTLTSAATPLVMPSGGGIEGGAGGTATVSGDIEIASGAHVAPGVTGTAGTLAFGNSLTLDNNSLATFKLSPTPGSGNDLITVGGNLTLNGTVNIGVGALGGGASFGNDYTLFTYTGTLTGNETNLVAPSLQSRQTYSMVPTASTPGSIQMHVGGGPSLALTWIGAPNTAVWNLIGNSNWKDPSLVNQQFYNLDSVTFDDTSTDPSTISVQGTLQPASVTVNATRNYTWGGSGAVAGSTGVTKQNTGTLIVANNNAYTGTTDIQGGILQVGNGGAVGTLGTGIVNVGGGTLQFNRSDANTFANVITGSGTIKKIGSNTLTLSGASSFTGPLVISAGTVNTATVANTGSNSPVGAGGGGDITLDGGTFQWTGAGAQTSNRTFALTANGGTLDASPTAGGVAITLSQTGALNFPDAGPRTVTLTGVEPTPLLIGTNSVALVINDQEGTTGKTSVVKNGNNRWQFTGANTYSGGTTINAGGLRIGNASGFGTGNVTVASGAQAYINTAGTVANNFSIAGVGPAEAPGTEVTGNYGALRVSNAGANLSGTITLAADARITGRGGGTGGTISGQITGAHALELGNSGGGTGTLILSNNINNWTGTTTVSHGTLKGGATNVIPHGAGTGNVVVNNSSTTIDSVLDLNGFDQQINGLSSSGADMTRVKVQNNSGTATLTVGDNNASASYAGGILAGTGTLNLAKTGSGTQTLTGTLSYTGNTTVNAGVLTVQGNLTTSANVSVTGGQLNLPSNGTFNRAIKTGTVAVTGGRLNIDNNKLIVTAQGVGTWDGSAYDGVTGLIANGYSPNQDFSGNGIVTTQTTATGGNTLHNIGVASNSDLGLATFGGQSVGPNDTLVMFTYGGDANLDGAITGDDYFQIDSGFPAGAHGWFNGDFNYDGSITGDDYFVIDSNFSAQGTPIPTSGGVSGGGLAGVQAVPEPASIGIIFIGGTTMLARRRRRIRDLQF